MSVTQASLLGDTFGSRASGTVPVGGIIMWSGSIASIPTGWALCNGSSGTPDLRDRFIVGAGSGYSVAGVGGTSDAIVVDHTHGITDTGHSHEYTDLYGVLSSTQYGSEGEPLFNSNQTLTKDTSPNTTGITINPSGVSGTNQNLPPYYALAYIMRTS